MEKTEIKKKLTDLLGEAYAQFLDIYHAAETVEERIKLNENAFSFYADYLIENGTTVLSGDEYVGRWRFGGDMPRATSKDPLALSSQVYTARKVELASGKEGWIMGEDSTENGKWRKGEQVDYWTPHPRPPYKLDRLKKEAADLLSSERLAGTPVTPVMGTWVGKTVKIPREVGERLERMEDDLK